MASLKDIAKECGVSVATVSKALNDQADISSQTKEKVRAAAERLGYSPNAAAISLKTDRTENIGVLFVDEARSGLTHEFFARILDSFKRTAEAHGYDITFINSSRANGSRLARMSYLEHARYRRFDGVVIACVDFTDPEVIELIGGEIPVVTIDHIFNNRTAILSDNIGGVKDLTTYCYNKGHRKIAFIHGSKSTVAQNRLSSFYRTAEQLGLEVPDAYVIPSDYRNLEAACRATEQLLDLPDPPTCILYPDDYSAFGGIKAIRRRGLRIPEDISIAGFDGTPIAEQIDPRLTTVAQNTEEMGRLAAMHLIEEIRHPKTSLVEVITVGTEVSPGESVGTCRK